MLPFGPRVNMGRPGTDDYSTVLPAASVGRIIDLADYFALDGPGAYAVSVRYEPVAEPDTPAQAWSGTLESDPITLTLD